MKPFHKGILALTGAALLVGCESESAAPPPPVRPVLSTVADRQAAALSAFAGTIEPRYSSSLAFRAGGSVIARNWLIKRPRWHVHLTPTSSSWLNQVERFFALITERKIRRGVYRSVGALRTDIEAFIGQHNADPKPFRWTKSLIRSCAQSNASADTTHLHSNVTNFWFRH